MTKEAFTIAYGGLPLEGEARDGELTWQTLICADRTPSGSLVVGVAEFPPGGHLKFTKPGLPPIYTGSTASDHRAARNARAQLRRADRQASAPGDGHG